MGGKKSESKNTTTTTNVGGTNAIHGDNLGVSVAGVNNSTMTITATDHGAVDKSLDFAESAAEFAMTSNAEVTGRALDSVDGAVDKAFGFGKDSLGVVVSIAGSSIDQLGDKHSENLQMLAGLSGSQGEQNSQNIKP